jgi:hypothetical protein
MEIHIVKDGVQTGPFPIDAVSQMVSAGKYAMTDLAWHEGLADWTPLSTILAGRETFVLRGNPANSQTLDESTRNEYLNHEASVKSIGILYYLGAAVLLGAAGMAGFAAFSGPQPDRVSQMIGAAAFLAVFGLINFWIGRCMRTLNPVGRIGATIFAVIGLLGFPLGTLINGYILYLLHSEKGKMVFSDEYRAVVAATPNIKYKTSIVVWIFLILIIAIIVIGVTAGLTHHR